jgi:uncharacterized membrane protein
VPDVTPRTHPRSTVPAEHHTEDIPIAAVDPLAPRNAHGGGDSPTHRAERWAAVVGSAALGLLAARDRSWRGLGLAVAGAPLVYRGATGHWPLPRGTTGRAAAALRRSELHVETSLTIERPRHEIYQFWRQLENLPGFMRHLESVRQESRGRSHWVARTPLGRRLEWEAELVDEQEGRLLCWRSLPGSRLRNAGWVLFEDALGGRGTVVRVRIEMSAPRLGPAKLVSAAAEQQLHEDLRRFKQLMEAGEAPGTKGNGREDGDGGDGRGGAS